MFIIIKNGNLIESGKSLTLFKNLKKNSKWITLNSILIQFYDLFDKYLIKIFFGPIALASYSIPQQLTGKLTIISKSFSAFLLPDLSKSKIDNQNFEFSLKIFIKIIPILIFCLFGCADRIYYVQTSQKQFLKKQFYLYVLDQY